LMAARIEALRERGLNPFDEHQVPSAALSLRQGFGRLIRSHEDQGVVAVLDPRVGTRGYGAAFLESLPACPRAASVEEVAAYFARPPRAIEVTRGTAPTRPTGAPRATGTPIDVS